MLDVLLYDTKARKHQRLTVDSDFTVNPTGPTLMKKISVIFGGATVEVCDVCVYEPVCVVWQLAALGGCGHCRALA